MFFPVMCGRRKDERRGKTETIPTESHRGNRESAETSPGIGSALPRNRAGAAIRPLAKPGAGERKAPEDKTGSSPGRTETTAQKAKEDQNRSRSNTHISA